MKNSKQFLNFPVPLLKHLYIDKTDFFIDVAKIGIYLFSTKLDDSTELECYKTASEILNFRVESDQRSIEEINKAKRILTAFQNYPTTGIELSMFWDYYKNKKNEFDIACLGAFLGIKSILGTKPYVKTNKAFIHARMFGYSTVGDMPEELTDLQKKYNPKRNGPFDRVLLELEINWSLKRLSNHIRGFYLSFDTSHSELATVIEDNKIKTKKHKLREAKKKAIQDAKY